jgi:hypothetical protein
MVNGLILQTLQLHTSSNSSPQAPHTENMKLLRVVVREDFSRSRCDIFLRDLKDAVSLHLRCKVG